ncbi:MAG: hypothetical protein JRN11_01455 [Nitrososphaerota archaeon]|nr:hypothetical protein [Nitrososphaerota archaeon]MDG7025398.1 hypothetical protein [Nitrososphaerota archaeon]
MLTFLTKNLSSYEVVIGMEYCYKMTSTSEMNMPPDYLKKTLGKGEQVQHYMREKFYHHLINVDSMAFTNARITLRQPHGLRLKKDYYNYRDTANVELKKETTRSPLKCTMRLGGEPFSLGDLSNSGAEKASGIIRGNLARTRRPLPQQLQDEFSIKDQAMGTDSGSQKGRGPWHASGRLN